MYFCSSRVAARGILLADSNSEGFNDDNDQVPADATSRLSSEEVSLSSLSCLRARIRRLQHSAIQRWPLVNFLFFIFNVKMQWFCIYVFTCHSCYFLDMHKPFFSISYFFRCFRLSTGSCNWCSVQTSCSFTLKVAQHPFLSINYKLTLGQNQNYILPKLPAVGWPVLLVN